MNYVLDAGPIIAFLQNEPGSNILEDLLTEPASTCYVHFENLAEIYYLYYRRGGHAAAEDVIQDISDLGIVIRDDHDIAFWKEAASYKGRHAMALPDGFCIALARRLEGMVVTTDHAEFDPVVPFGYCPVLFIR